VIEGHRSPCDEGVLRAAPAGEPCPERDRPWVLAATILGSSLAFVEGSVVNVALPAIQRALDATAPQMQWVLNAYLLLLGALLLVGGAAGDRFGRRRVFAWGVAVFAAASAWCALTGSAAALVAARTAQGLGAALLVPNSLAILAAAYGPAERGKAIGTWAGFSALTGAVGPLVGGWLVDALSWRAAFWVVLPPAAVTLAIALWRVPESRDPGTARLDLRGAGLATAGLGAATYGLIASSEAGWGAVRVWGPLAAGALLLALFARTERRIARPMMPPALFRSSTFTGANLMTLALYFALSGALYLLPFNLIQVQGYSATQAGAAFLPFTLLMAGLSRWAGGLLDRWGPRKPLILGPLVAAAGLALLAVPGVGGSYWTGFFPAMVVLGLGMTVAVAPLTTVVMNAAGEGRAGVASAINNAAARVAGLLAVAVLGVVVLGVFGAALDHRLAALDGVPPELRREVLAARADLAAIELPDRAAGETRVRLDRAIDESFVHGFRWAALIAAALAALSALAAWRWIEPAAALAQAAAPGAGPASERAASAA
jgi:EmrB/QacA subfamily drug resistance transporter